MAITYREAEQMVYDALDAYAHRNVGRTAAASDVLGVLRGLLDAQSNQCIGGRCTAEGPCQFHGALPCGTGVES